MERLFWCLCLNYMLVNINDWCKNKFEVVDQFRINTDNSHPRYDAILLSNGVPAVQIELKTLSINPRRITRAIPATATRATTAWPFVVEHVRI